MSATDHVERLRRAARAIESLKTRLVEVESAKTEPIALIGIGCRFPGGVEGPDDFWRLLDAGREAIGEVPPDRWDIDAVYHPDKDAPGKMYSRAGHFLDRIDQFDPQFFSISPREAANLDPQQRLLLEVAWEALENAGLAPETLYNTQTAVAVGISCFDFALRRLSSPDAYRAIDSYLSSGTSLSVAAGRISHALGIQGPCFSVDTLCSSSLVAVHQACQALRAGECDLALAGGVNVLTSPAASINFCRARMLSEDGRCKTFDDAADGYGRGEGCAIVVLKRLSDAVAAGDPIWAVVRGSAINHDGPSGGLTVPNGPAQQAVIRRALALGGVAPDEVDYVECHGTGTPLGDPIEAGALGAVYGGGGRAQPLRIGSVKTNIGHLEAAAGIAGLIKTVLALHHQRIPAHLHFRTPNSRVPWDDLGLEVTAAARPWPAGSRPRLAGVSAFGMSGTNTHVVLSEAPHAATPCRPRRPAPAFHRQDFPLDPPDTADRVTSEGAGEGATQFPLRLDHSWLAEHRVFGRALVPLAVILDAMQAAGRRLYRVGPLALHDVALSGPVSPSGLLDVDVRVEPVAPAGFAVTLCRSGTARPFASARVVEARGELGTDEGSLAPPNDPTDEAAATVAAYYQSFAGFGIAYGPSFRTLTGVTPGESAATAALCLPEGVTGEGAGGLHPLLLDGAIQAVGAAIPSAWPRVLLLPVGAAGLDVRGDLGRACACRVMLAPTSTPERVEADIRVRSATGAAVLRGLILEPAPPQDEAALASAPVADARDALHQIAARVLRLAPEALDPARPLTAMGLDSLLALEVRNAARTEAGLDLALADLLGGASVNDLLGGASASSVPPGDGSDMIEDEI